MDNHNKVEAYYSKLGYKVNKMCSKVLRDVYLQNLLSEDDIKGKKVLEIGAGASQYKDIFLDWGCKSYTGVELLASRIPDDQRQNVAYVKGAFETSRLEQNFDILFCSLTYMYIRDRTKFYKKVYEVLSIGGNAIFLEPNSIMPLTFLRFLKARYIQSSPIQFTSPLILKKALKKYGFEEEHLEYFTRDYKLTNNFLLGSNFKMAMKKVS